MQLYLFYFKLSDIDTFPLNKLSGRMRDDLIRSNIIIKIVILIVNWPLLHVI